MPEDEPCKRAANRSEQNKCAKIAACSLSANSSSSFFWFGPTRAEERGGAGHRHFLPPQKEKPRGEFSSLPAASGARRSLGGLCAGAEGARRGRAWAHRGCWPCWPCWPWARPGLQRSAPAHQPRRGSLARDNPSPLFPTSAIASPCNICKALAHAAAARKNRERRGALMGWASVLCGASDEIPRSEAGLRRDAT